MREARLREEMNFREYRLCHGDWSFGSPNVAHAGMAYGAMGQAYQGGGFPPGGGYRGGRNTNYDSSYRGRNSGGRGRNSRGRRGRGGGRRGRGGNRGGRGRGGNQRRDDDNADFDATIGGGPLPGEYIPRNPPVGNADIMAELHRMRGVLNNLPIARDAGRNDDGNEANPAR